MISRAFQDKMQILNRCERTFASANVLFGTGPRREGPKLTVGSAGHVGALFISDINPCACDRVRTDPGKSWNFIVQNSRLGKSWKRA